jgi:hypothetical protein
MHFHVFFDGHNYGVFQKGTPHVVLVLMVGVAVPGLPPWPPGPEPTAPAPPPLPELPPRTCTPAR